MKTGEIVHLKIPGTPEYIAIVRRAVEGIAKRMCFDNVQIEDLKLAVGEACTNAVKYGCRCDGDIDAPVVEITCTVMHNGLLVEITNSINCCESPIVPNEPDLTKEGGLGLYLIRQVMDEVQFNWQTETATISMLKRISQAV